ncbi:MAG: S-adenosylmethionine decarboxylase [Chitinophagaceae bacterium]|nr:S-adenosylmethionine decarboxylase [Chitinophagaceae bacterium]
MHDYNPGLHIVSTFKYTITDQLDAQHCRLHFDKIISATGLHKVGEVYHEFDTGGFTAVICLTESHISIHTWPEHGLATFDVFLSNFNENNSEKAREIYNSTLVFFDATETNKQEIMR